MKKTTTLVLLIVLLIMASSCLAVAPATEEAKPSGFFMGIWHGWVAPIALIVKLFNPTVTVFDPNNSGFFYELGFYMAIISGFGGLSLARKNKCHKQHD